MKKLHYIMVNIMSFVIILLLLVLPLFKLSSPNGDIVFETKTIYGFHFVSGYVIKNKEAIEVIDKYSQVLTSKMLGILPAILIFSIFLIDKLSKNDVGKDIINFLAAIVVSIYVFTLPITASTFITSQYYGYLEFNKIGGFWILFSATTLYVVYFLVKLIFTLINVKKLENSQNEPTVEKTNEDKAKLD